MTSIPVAAQRIAAQGRSAPRPARDPVNLPTVRNWVEAMGDANPVYTDEVAAAASVHKGLVAPPAMIQVWTMPGLHGTRPADDPLSAMSALLDEAGYNGVVATNCEQTYHRYLRHGEQLSASSELVDVVGPKRTALGEGWFFTTKTVWTVADEPVAEMLFRILKYRPASASTSTSTESTHPQRSSYPQVDQATPVDQGRPVDWAGDAPREREGAGGAPVVDQALRPSISLDTEFFWAGTAAGELRIQQCAACGRLRHPPGPMCPSCGGTEQGYVLAAGTGTVFSYVVHHHPPVPGRKLPFVIALVELDEGVRMLGELQGANPESVHIGQQVRVAFQQVDAELTLAVWRPL